MPASFALDTWMSPATPVSCMAQSACIDTPVAPIGWPLDFNPPDGLIGSLPSFWVQPSLIARAPCPLGVNPIASYSINSATVKQSWVSTKDKSESCTPADSNARCQATVQPSNCNMSRLDIGRK